MVRPSSWFVAADLVVRDSFAVRSKIFVNLSWLLVVVRCEIMWPTGFGSRGSGHGGGFYSKLGMFDLYAPSWGGC